MPATHMAEGAGGGAGDPAPSCRVRRIVVLSAHVEVEEAMELLAGGDPLGLPLEGARDRR